jgi:hypothetical protein
MLTKVMVAVLLMASSAVVARAQSRFTVDTGESGRHEGRVVGPAVATLNIVTGRMQFRAEMPLSASHADGAEIGVAYNVSRFERASFFAGIDVAPADPSDLSLRFESELTLEQGEIEAELTAGVGAEHDVALELTGNFADSRWRGTLDVRRESDIPALRITPGAGWKVRDVRVGMGVTLPSARESNPSLVLKAVFEF